MDIQLLKNLFDQCQEEKEDSSDSENETNSKGATFGPGDIKTKKSIVSNTLENPLLKKIDEGETIKSMKDLDDIQRQDEELLETRKQPDYSIAYKQAVTTENIYLQMGLKTPATSSCEDMILNIQLSEEQEITINDMELNVEEDKVELKTPIYRLNLMLPHKVYSSKGRAEYDATKKSLKITLKMNREYDFVNF